MEHLGQEQRCTFARNLIWTHVLQPDTTNKWFSWNKTGWNTTGKSTNRTPMSTGGNSPLRTADLPSWFVPRQITGKKWHNYKYGKDTSRCQRENIPVKQEHIFWCCTNRIISIFKYGSFYSPKHTNLCMYVCRWVCMHVCMYVCMHACMYVWVSMSMSMSMCVYDCLWMSVIVYVCLCMHMYAYACMCMYMYILSVYIYIYIYLLYTTIHVSIYIYIQV